MITAFLGLGSNLGDKVDNINLAIKMLSDSDKIRVKGVSSLYQTEPVGVEKQEDYLN
jgi:2-amino-4-hydroxy-6-hydroxymethyldihydropteridine diphosphokinase